MKFIFVLLTAFVTVGAFAETPKSLYSAKYERQFFLGLKKNPDPMRAAPDTQYLESDVKVPVNFYWPDKVPLPAGLPYDQGQCGSCVVNSIDGNVTYNLAIRGLLPAGVSPLSRGQVMECNPTAGQCQGDWAENVGGWVGNRGHLLSESVYSYRAQNGRCRGITGTEFGPIPKGRVIDNSPESIGKALVSVGPVSTTIGADNRWMNTDGEYSAAECTQQGTNHEVLIIGMRAKGAAVGADGFIDFRAAKPGEIEIGILNSWGQWAKGGVVWMPITDLRGRLCNNVTEEIYAFDWPLLAKPVDGGWTLPVFGECVNGFQTSAPRTCTNPAPSGGGKVCEGNAVVTQPCVVPTPDGPGLPVWVWLVFAGLGVVIVVLLLVRKG